MKKLYIIFMLLLVNFKVLANYEESCDSLDDIEVNINTNSIVKVASGDGRALDGGNTENLKCLYYDSNSFTDLIDDEVDRLNSILKSKVYKQIIFPAKTFRLSKPITIPRNHLGTVVTLRGTAENNNTTTLIANAHPVGNSEDSFIFTTIGGGDIGDKGLVIEGFKLENNQCNQDSENCGILKYIGDGARINNNSFNSVGGICIFHNTNESSSSPGFNNLISDNDFKCRNAFYAPLISRQECAGKNNKQFCSLPTDQLFVNNNMSCGENCIESAGFSGTQFIENQFKSDGYAISNIGRDYWISLHNNKYENNKLFELKAYTTKIESVFTYPTIPTVEVKPEKFSYIITGNINEKYVDSELTLLEENSNIYNLYSSTLLCNKIGICEDDISLRFNEIISYANGTPNHLTLYVPDNIGEINNTELVTSNLTLLGAGSNLSSITFGNPLIVSDGGALTVKNINLKGSGEAVINVKDSELKLLHSSIGKYEGDCVRLEESKKIIIEKSSFYNCNVGINGSFSSKEPDIEISQSTFSNVVELAGPKEIKSFIKVEYDEDETPIGGSIKLTNNHIWGDPTEYFFDIRNVKKVDFVGNDIENLGRKARTYGSNSVSKVKLLKLSGNSNATFSHNIFRVTKPSNDEYYDQYLINSRNENITFDSNIISFNVGSENVDGFFDAFEKIKLMPLNIESFRENRVFESNTNKIKLFSTSANNAPDIFEITMNISKPEYISVKYFGENVEVKWTEVDNAVKYMVEYRVENSGWTSLGNYSARVLKASHTVNSGLSYQYRVKSCDSASWCSEWVESGYVHILSRPAFVKASVKDNKDITVEWARVPNVGFYKRETANSEWGWKWGYNRSYTDTTTTVTYLDQPPRSSMYKVKACNAHGCSYWEESGKIGIIPPPPESVSAWITPNPSEPNKHDMNVNWSWVRGATYYIREVFSAGDWRYPIVYTGLSVVFPKYNSGLKRFRVKACIGTPPVNNTFNEKDCSDWRVQKYPIRVP